jgi:hypothetical protein
MIKKFHKWYIKNKYGVTYTKSEIVGIYITSVWMLVFIIPSIIGMIISNDRTMMWCAVTMLGVFYYMLILYKAQTRRLRDLLSSLPKEDTR